MSVINAKFHNAIDPRNLARALGGEVRGDQILAPGPAHSAKDRSLSVKIDPGAPDGFIVHSFAGDDPIICRDYVREKGGLGPFKPSAQSRNRQLSTRSSGPRIVDATYDYKDESGTLLYQVIKYKPKGFSQRRPDGNGGWIPNLRGVRQVLYRLPEILQHPYGTVFVCEGEKDADRVATLGNCATTVASWTDDCIKALAGRDIIILQDDDQPGTKKALDAAQALHSVAKSIRIVLLPDLPPGGDVSDWLDADRQRDGEMLARICWDAPEWTPVATLEANDGDPLPLIKSSKEFVADFVPPDYLVDGLLQEAFLYSLTGATGAGKTAITLRLAASVALGVVFANCETKKRRVLYLAAENPCRCSHALDCAVATDGFRR
jgi:AAA domain